MMALTIFLGRADCFGEILKALLSGSDLAIVLRGDYASVVSERTDFRKEISFKLSEQTTESRLQ